MNKHCLARDAAEFVVFVYNLTMIVVLIMDDLVARVVAEFLVLAHMIVVVSLLWMDVLVIVVA